MTTKYLCDDGDAEIEIEADSAQEAAQEYVDGGDYGDGSETVWIAVYVQEIDEDGEEVGERDRITITLDAETPDCEADEHDWCSPYSVLGGVKENPGVWGHGGGVIIKECCAHCGRYKITDTWAQDPSTGEQVLGSVGYADADGDSRAWIERRMLERAEEIMDGLDYVESYERAGERRDDGKRYRIDATLTDPEQADALERALGDGYMVCRADDDPVVQITTIR